MVRVLVNPAAPAFDLWWEAAEAVGSFAPGPMLRMLMGADIHVTEFQAADIKAWAMTIKGWNPDASADELPLLFQSTGSDTT